MPAMPPGTAPPNPRRAWSRPSNPILVRNIESYDLSLRAVIDNLAYPEITTVSPELRQLVLFDRSATAKHLDAIVLLDQNGIVRLDSRTPFPKPVSRAERDYFQFHKNSQVFALHISEPIVARETGTRVITISRRLSNPDGIVCRCGGRFVAAFLLPGVVQGRFA